jgi:hypothetical protein
MEKQAPPRESRLTHTGARTHTHTHAHTHTPGVASTKTAAREGTAGTGSGAVAKSYTRRLVSRKVDSAETDGEGGVKIKAKEQEDQEARAAEE